MGQAEEWQDLTSAETRRLEREEKNLKFEIVRKKKSKYGKAGNSKLTALEEAIISSQTRKLSELAEVKQNLSRKEAKRKGWKVENRPSRNIPESRKENQLKTGQDRDKNTSCEVEEHWLKLISSKKFIETNERWVTATWLENSSLEEQRGMAYEKDVKRHRLCDVDEHEETQRIVERGSHQDCFKKAGKIIKNEGNKEEVTSMAWRVCRDREGSRTHRSKEYTRR